MSSVREAREAACASLQASSPSPQADADYLLMHVLKKDRAWLRAHDEISLSEQESSAFETMLRRRLHGEPIAYITGERGFWSLDLQVNANTLIPRPETELLVEFALEKIPASVGWRVLDLGVGSGAIALAVKRERPSCVVTAVDTSHAALETAAGNAHRLELDIEFLHSDWFSSLVGRRFDLVLANPPYIAMDDPHLGQGDVRFEPLSALVSAEQGMQDIRRIVEAAPAHLASGGWLVLEHGSVQGAAVRQLLASQDFADIETRCDLAGHERVTLGCWNAGTGPC